MEREDGMLFIGPEAERKFGRRHFMELMAVFTAPPEFTVLLGSDPPAAATRRASGVLAGLRSDAIGRVAATGTVVAGADGDLRWWTWAGYKANATLRATLESRFASTGR